jgi:hypothetical protein
MVFNLEVNTMKTIIASAAVAVASLGVAGVASAQGINVVSPYVGIEHYTAPVEDGFWGDNTTNFTTIYAGTEVYLPFDLTLDAEASFDNEVSDTLTGFDFTGVDLELSYEMDMGVELYVGSKWNGTLDRESTSFGAKWQF